MTVPLDKLYHFIDNLAQETSGDCVIIYRFFPHGSKNIQDLNRLRTWTWPETIIYPALWCHDQEPLNHNYYKHNLRPVINDAWEDTLISVNMNTFKPKNLNYTFNWYDKNLLLHSELRSHNVKKYLDDSELIPVYYWSHAVLALDWFRYAQHETFKKHSQHTFLIYNRAWAGTREYRLKFADLLFEHNLVNHCKTNFNAVDPESQVHYTCHTFANPVWQPTHALEQAFEITQAHSASSADFVTADYETTDIEVVLETLFDDDRLHLTEKILRPIACGQPFVLAATHGSLEYLRSYGFKTFDLVWDESYDQEPDPVARLNHIVDVMKTIAQWDPATKKQKMHVAHQIAQHNRQWFFSEQFFDLVINELRNNLKTGFDTLLSNKDNYKTWLARWSHWLSNSKINDFLIENSNQFEPNKQCIDFLFSAVKQKLTVN